MLKTIMLYSLAGSFASIMSNQKYLVGLGWVMLGALFVELYVYV